MKQVININFHGRVIPIETTAFDLLKAYTESLNRYFAQEDGKEEIINDIESRIAELFQERLKAGATCITDEDVQAIIRNMGRPEDFETTENTSGFESTNQQQQSTFTQSGNSTTATPKRLYRDENDKVFGGVCSGLANYFGIDVVVMRIIFVILAISFGFGLIPYLVLWVAVPSTATKEIGGMRKKLYRDSDDKIIAGVCSGIANYFGINVWIPRVLFLVPFLSFVANWNHWAGIDFPSFVRFTFSPGSLLLYVILWIVLPEATTTSEKLEMKGEKVDMNSIKNSIVEEMKGVQQRAEKFGKEARQFAEEKSETIRNDVRTASRRTGRSFGDVIVLIFKIFAYIIFGSIAFSLVVALFAFGVVSVGLFPAKDFILTDGWQNVFAWGTLIFFIAVPIIGVITWLIRKLGRMKRNSRQVRISFIALWTIGWASFICLIASVGRDFKSINNFSEEDVYLSNPAVPKLEITSIRPNQKYYRYSWFRMEPFEGLEEDTLFVQNINIHIVKSPNDSFRVTMMKLAHGNNRRYADTLASLIQFNAVQQDSILLIDRGISINKTDKFRNQRVILTVYVPVGKQIKISRSIGWPNNVHFDGPWTRQYNLDMQEDDVEHGWQPGETYIMKEDGLYTVDENKPADTWKHRNQNTSGDFDDENNTTPANGEGYRYDQTQPKPVERIDSMKQKLEEEKKKANDSLIKAKEKIEQEIKKLNTQAKRTNPADSFLPAYTIQTYNPMLTMK